MVDIHHVCMENHVGNSTTTELSTKKSNVTKKLSLNKINVNNKTSDVVSNQSLNNSNLNDNNISVGDTTAKSASVSQSISDADSLNNNINTNKMNDKNRNHADAGDVRNVTNALNAQNYVHIQSAANYPPKEIMLHGSVNSHTDNINNGKLCHVQMNFDAIR